MQQDLSQDSDSPSAWTSARRCAEGLGRPPDTLLLCARALMAHVAANGEQTRDLDLASRHLLKRLLRSRTFRARIYFAADALKPEVLAGYPSLGWNEFLSLFTPYEYAALITLIALHRQAKISCPGEEWPKLSYHLYAGIDLGYLLGASIARIGSVTGMLVGAMRPIALSAFGKRDAAGFKNYRKHLKLKSIINDPAMEMTTWGCTSQKVSALLLQQFGFGIEYTRHFVQALENTLDEHLEGKAIAIRVASRWVDGLFYHDSPPTSSLGDEFDISQHKLEALAAKLDKIKQDHTKNHWLMRTAADISAESCPALFNADHLMSAKKGVKTATDEVKNIEEQLGADEPPNQEISDEEPQ